MGYRIQYFRRDLKMGDIPSNAPLPETREKAVENMDLFRADYALILDEAGQQIDRMKRSA